MKICLYCEKELIRRKNEDSYSYKRRNYCNASCRNFSIGIKRREKLKDRKGKICPFCKIFILNSEFYYDSRNKMDNLSPYCIKCTKIMGKEKRDKIKILVFAHYSNNIIKCMWENCN